MAFLPGSSPSMVLRIYDWARLCRPKHWSKNVFVLLPTFFSEHFTDLNLLLDGLLAFICFCPLSSAMYIANDTVDRKADRQHPRKQSRPIAAGRISVPVALLGSVGLIVCAFALAVFTLPLGFLLAMAAYAGNTIAYILWLKQRVIVDVMLIAIGFVIRLLAGCIAANVEPSSWLIICGFSLALVLGFGKRRTEIEAADVSSQFRSTLLSYNRSKLDTILAVCTAVCLLSYMLYTVAPETVQLHGTKNLVYTVPLVAYGLFRYLFKAQEGRKDEPTDILFADPVFAITGVLWVSAVLLVLMFK